MAQYVMSMLRVSKVVPPKRQIIKDISLSFFPGAKIGLLGLNGAGKSTLLRIIAGLEEATAGDVYIGDELANDVPPAKRGTAMVFQSYALYPQSRIVAMSFCEPRSWTRVLSS